MVNFSQQKKKSLHFLYIQPINSPEFLPKVFQKDLKSTEWKRGFLLIYLAYCLLCQRKESPNESTSQWPFCLSKVGNEVQKLATQFSTLALPT